MLCIGADGEQCHYINISEGLGVKLPNINRGGEMAGCTRLICNDVSPPPVCTNLEARCVRTCTRNRHTIVAYFVPYSAGSAACQQRDFWLLLVTKVTCESIVMLKRVVRNAAPYSPQTNVRVYPFILLCLEISYIIMPAATLAL